MNTVKSVLDSKVLFGHQCQVDWKDQVKLRSGGRVFSAFNVRNSLLTSQHVTPNYFSELPLLFQERERERL